MLADQGMIAFVDPLDGGLWVVPLLAFLPPLACVVLEYFVVQRTVRLATSGFASSLRRASTRLRIMQWIVVGSTAISLFGLGWLELIRHVTGNLVLLDELLAVLPALFLLAMLWRVQWPLERLLRESVLIRRMDQGLPIHPIPSAGGYVIGQFRTHLLLILGPALMILALVESADLLARTLVPGEDGVALAPWLAGAAGLTGLALAPFAIAFVVGAHSMPEGTLRGAMEQVLRDAEVRVRDILVWPTGGGILNGAVIGLLPRLRYVLLTDGLLELLTLDQIRAVMAHETGHLRYRHLPWTAVILVTLIAGYGQLAEWIINPIFQTMVSSSATPDKLHSSFEIIAVVVVIGCCFMSFGLVSRRFELQADAAAACDLTFRTRGEDASAAAGVVSEQSVTLMNSALTSVAVINGLDPRRHTWRHGSIRWRQRRLRGIIGCPLDALPIDRQVRRLKWGTVGLLCLLALVWFGQSLDVLP